jgi:hypothetical protein
MSRRRTVAHFTVSFFERTFDDIRALDDGFYDERPFAAVARSAEVQAQIYDALLRPAIKSIVTETTAEMSRALHPQRLSRALMSSKNPLMKGVEGMAETIREGRIHAATDNPFLATEALVVQMTEQAIDFARRSRHEQS